MGDGAAGPAGEDLSLSRPLSSSVPSSFFSPSCLPQAHSPGGRIKVTSLADLQWLPAPPSFQQRTRQELPSLFQSHAVQSGCPWTHAALYF